MSTLQNAHIRSTNSSKKYAIGTKHPTMSCGEVEIVGQLDLVYCTTQGSETYPYFRVKFKDETEINTSSGSLRKEKIWNPNQRGTYGVGYLGIGTHPTILNGKSTREFILWDAMMARCYYKNALNRCPTYLEVSVTDYWHCFQNFAEDLSSLKGYTEWKEHKIQYDLDKDTKVKGNKIYSKETCVFITHKENTARGARSSNITGLTYIATRLSDGYTEEFTNQTEFAENYNLSQANISSYLSGNYKFTHVKGWTFEKIKENK